MSIQFANNAASSLASAAAAADTVLTLAAGEGDRFPQPDAALGRYFLCTLANAAGDVEVAKATARSGDALTVERAQEGTTALDWAAGDKVELRLTAGSLGMFVQSGDLDPVEPNRIKGVRYVSASADITDHGDVAQEGSLAWTLAQAGAESCVLELPGAHTYALATSLSLPAQVVLRFQPGAVLQVASNTVLTVNCGVEAGLHQLFSGTGSVAGSPRATAVPPQWFGAQGDGVADDSDALDKALAFSRVWFPRGTYLCSRTLDLPEGAWLEGEAGHGGYIDWSGDFQQGTPTYAGRAAVMQRAFGSHGPLFSARDGATFRNMVFRCGQVRDATDAFFASEASHVTLEGCRFENLENVIADTSHSQEFGALKVSRCGFFACGRPFRGVLVDSQILGCLFTSCDVPVHVVSGGGLNVLSGNRLEWNTRGVMGYGCRSMVVTGNLFDSHEETGVYMHDVADWNVTNNVFWRNGRDGSGPRLRSHVVLKGEGLSGNRIAGNTFVKGADDGVSTADRPLHVVEVEGAANTYTVFRDNDTVNGCVDLPVLDTYLSSPDSLLLDEVHVKGILSPGTGSDGLQDVCKHVAKTSACPVDVHVYEDRAFTVIAGVEAETVRLVGHGGPTLTDSGGCAVSLLGLENLTYGPAWGARIGQSRAASAPTNGQWTTGAIVWNSAPAAGGSIGWVCVSGGEPGTWKSFGAIAA